MKFSMSTRGAGKKSENNRIRRAGNIPAILYGVKGEPQTFFLQGTEVEPFFRKLEKGMAATTVFELETDKGPVRAILKEIQRHRVSHDIIHLDFQEIQEDKPITVNVSIRLLGQMDCVGVKLGGFVRQVIRALKVQCLPKDLPKTLDLNVQPLGVGEVLRLRDIPLPEKVRPVAQMEQVAVVIAKKKG